MYAGKKIERVRLLRGITQSELGEKLGITKQAVSKMERSQKMDEDKMRQVLGVLGMDTSDFECKDDLRDCARNDNYIRRAQLLYEELIRIEKENFENMFRTKNLEIDSDNRILVKYK